ncbi:hypothetical protein Pelo_3824 [Pelomyxa schiedti]|nr:hypothetical protein Pelo_3824 [Pelomyxa schiedti]
MWWQEPPTEKYARAYNALHRHTNKHLVKVLTSKWIRSNQVECQLSPCYVDIPRTEHYLAAAVYTVLVALETMHSCNVYHCDIRWVNTMRSCKEGHWMLVDLEWAQVSKEGVLKLYTNGEMTGPQLVFRKFNEGRKSGEAPYTSWKITCRQVEIRGTKISHPSCFYFKEFPFLQEHHQPEQPLVQPMTGSPVYHHN